MVAEAIPIEVWQGAASIAGAVSSLSQFKRLTGKDKTVAIMASSFLGIFCGPYVAEALSLSNRGAVCASFLLSLTGMSLMGMLWSWLRSINKLPLEKALELLQNFIGKAIEILQVLKGKKNGGS